MKNREFHGKDEKRYNTDSSLKWLVSHVIRYRWTVLVFLAVVFLSIYYQNSASVYLGKIFDGLKTNLGRGVMKWVFWFFALSIGQGLLHLASTYSILYLRLKVERDIRQEIYVSLLGKSQTFHDGAKTGEIMALSTNEIRNISIMFQPGIIMTLRSLLSYFIPLGFIMANFQLALLVNPLLFTGLSMILLYLYSRNINKVTKITRRQFGNLNTHLNETIDGIKIVKSNSQENREIEKFQKNSGLVFKLSLKRAMIESTYLPTLVFAVFFGISIYQLFTMFSRGQLTLGQVVTYLAIYQNLRYPIANAEITFSFIGLGIASAGRIIKMLKMDTDINHDDEGFKKEITGKIEFKNVSFGYENGDLLLEKVNFTIYPGETVAIVGSTGIGKSTLAKLINRIYDTCEGQVLIDDVDVRDWDLDSLRSQIGIIEQDIFLFSWSIEKNISFGYREGSECPSEILQQSVVDACAHEFIMSFPDKYKTIIGERGVQLSGGQRQRLVISRVLLSNPKILILDDHTSAVDSETEDKIHEAIRGMMKQKTMLLITHRLAPIRWADRILMIRKGKTIVMGTHEELYEKYKEYRDIFAGYL